MSEIEDLKRKLALSCRMLFHAGLFDYSGHISARLSGTDRFLINPHPVSRALVKPADVLTADLDGKRLDGPWSLPSELPMHTRIYRMREDVRSIAHLHSRMVTVLSMADRPLIPASNVGALFGSGPVPVYKDPALIQSDEQGDAVARTLGDRNAVVLRGHGSIVVGESLELAFVACVDLEESAAKLYHASLLGPVRPYTEDEITRVSRGRKRPAAMQKIWDHYVAKAKVAGLLEDL